MKERPILFSGPMVRALLAGTKTQTRRVVKPEPKACDHKPWPGDYKPNWVVDQDGWHCATCGNGVRLDRRSPSGVSGIRCPYGQPGDRLWVKETWRPREDAGDWHLTVGYAADAQERRVPAGLPGARGWSMPKAAARGNVSPLFMPRWASRITLDVTGVRVERLQDISIADAMAEGVADMNDRLRGLEPCMEWRYAYEDLWKQINGPGSWDANPWVWVVEFARVAP